MLEWSRRTMEQLESHPIQLKITMQCSLQWRLPLPSGSNWPCCSRDLISHVSIILCQDPNKLTLPFNKHFFHESVSVSVTIYAHTITTIGLIGLKKHIQFYLYFRSRVHLKHTWKANYKFEGQNPAHKTKPEVLALSDALFFWNRIAM